MTGPDLSKCNKRQQMNLLAEREPDFGQVSPLDDAASQLLTGSGITPLDAAKLRPFKSEAGTYCNFLAGGWVAPDGFLTLYENTNPADITHIYGNVPESGPSVVESACLLASRDAKAWAENAAALGVAFGQRVVQLLNEHAEAVCGITSRDTGQSLFRSKLELIETIDLLNGVIESLQSTEGTGHGAIALITPYSSALAIPTAHLVAALGAGNTVVWKPSHLAPEISFAVAQIVMQAVNETATLADLPVRPGVLSVVHGGHDTGCAICASEWVQMVSVLGSDRTVERVLDGASGSGKSVIANGTSIHGVYVSDRCNVQQVARNLVYGKTAAAGQQCRGIQEALCHRDAYDAFLAAVKEYADQIVIDGGLSEAVAQAEQSEDMFALTPLVSFLHQKGFRTLVGKAVRQGALPVYQQELSHTFVRIGYFSPFTVLADVDEDNLLSQTEVLGPCLVVHSVADEAQAIAHATRRPGVVLHHCDSEDAGPLVGAESDTPLTAAEIAGLYRN